LAEPGHLQEIEALALGTLASAEAWLGELESAILRGHRALALLKRSCDAGARAYNLCTLVMAYLCASLPADALACATAAITVARSTGEPSLMSSALNRAASTHRALGEAERGVELLEEALRLAQEFHLVEEEARACNNLCGVLLTLAAEQAGQQCQDTLARASRCATACSRAPIWRQAIWPPRSRRLAERHGYRLAALTAHIVCATLQRERGNVDASIALYNELLDETRGTGDFDWVEAVHQGLHDSHKLRNDPEPALEHM
jgi:tetratricopeptide (TPR) repeat protein